MSDDMNDILTSFEGPEYKYYNYIKTPTEMGMSENWSDFTNDWQGLMSYSQILVEGTGKASKTGQPLGNKFFLKTAASCVANDTQDQVDRYIYINNVPVGNIPFISSAAGVNFSTFRGLIPGLMGNLNNLNLGGIFQSAMSGTTPPCQQITMETVDENNNHGSDSHYVATVDIQNMDPCIFTLSGKTNPVSGEVCREGFTSSSPAPAKHNPRVIPSSSSSSSHTHPPPYEFKDPLVRIFFVLFAALLIYFVYLLGRK
jgi:FlaG/FlaF family flagellin (archaellin)